jgi:hypothetical protein
MMGGFVAFVTLFFFIMMIGLRLPIFHVLALTLVYGGFTAGLAWLGMYYRERLQRRAFQGKKQASDDAESHQQRMIEVDLPLEEAYDLALDGLQALDGQPVPVPDDPLLRMESLVPRTQKLRLIRSNREMGDIDAALRLRTLGLSDVIDFSRITIRLQRVDTHTTRVQIESQPASILTEYDLGKNMHYVNHLALHLRRESDQRQAARRLGNDDSSSSAAQDDADAPHSSAQAST